MMSTALQQPLPLTPVEDTRAKSAEPRKPKFDYRYLMPAFITVILLSAHFMYGVLESPWYTLAAIGTSIACELALSRWVWGKWPSLVSSYISGISVGILVRSDQGVWPYVLCAAISIVSKYAIRIRGRHIWNPSNFAVTVMLVSAADVYTSLGQHWGNYIPVMAIIWALGSFIVGRLHRFHICLTYVLTWLALVPARAWAQGNGWEVELAPITGPMYQLFIFFMITDPPTTVRSYRGQIIVAAMVAVIESVIRCLPVYAHLLGMNDHTAGLIANKAPYLGLFIVGPVANLVDIFLVQPAKK